VSLCSNYDNNPKLLEFFLTIHILLTHKLATVPWAFCLIEFARSVFLTIYSVAAFCIKQNDVSKGSPIRHFVAHFRCGWL